MVSLTDITNNESRIDSKAKLQKLQNVLSTLPKNQLPISVVKKEFIKKFQDNRSLIVIGETGCGKTTQIPKYIYEFYATRNYVRPMVTDRPMTVRTIAITQPRRVAATSIADRVAHELNVQLGALVGYTIRFEDKSSQNTRIKYMTDGILLREAIADPKLSKYSVIILDEAHERTVHTDILFGIVKKAQRLRECKRPADENPQDRIFPLKLIIMSATMDVDNFRKYFNNAPALYIAGRTYPIKILYAQDKITDYVKAALTTVFQIHQTEHEVDYPEASSVKIGGDIIVFCTGQEEIEGMIKTVQDLSRDLSRFLTPSGVQKTLKAYPLYAALPNQKQQLVFNRKPEDSFRRVIFATNIAETSVTIPNVRFVVDTGKMKSRIYSSKTNYEVMLVENVSKAQAAQRSGRAGRTAPGKCYRLYTKPDFKNLRSFPIPEIQKCNLSSVLLQIIAIGITDVREFDFVDRPSDAVLDKALEVLQDLKAIGHSDDTKKHFRLTDLGRKLVAFPVDVKFAAILVAAEKFGCLEEAIAIVSMLSVDSVFFVPNAERDLALKVHKKFSSTEGDIIKLLTVFRKYREARQSQSWCHENFLRAPQLKMVMDIRQQLLEVCTKLNITRTSTPNTETVRHCFALAAGPGNGLGGNIALLQKDGNYRIVPMGRKTVNTGDNDRDVHIHPSSCLFEGTVKPECVLFIELVHTSKSYMRNVTLVNSKWFTDADSNGHALNTI